VTLRWQVQQRVATIPRTSNPARLAENFDIFDFALSDAEMARIFDLARPDGRLGNWLDAAFEWDAD
jgi:diketogulonate reductase-like aldo/keto reductase